jgi:hypothetical protein
MRIEPIGSILSIMPYTPITPIKRRNPPKVEKIEIIRDENLGKYVDITISGSIYKHYRK